MMDQIGGMMGGMMGGENGGVASGEFSGTSGYVGGDAGSDAAAAVGSLFGGRRLFSQDCQNFFCEDGQCKFTNSQDDDEPNEENPPSYNCLSKEVWSEEKQSWCCTFEDIGCYD